MTSILSFPLHRFSLQNFIEGLIVVLLGVFILCLPYYWYQSSYILAAACVLALIDRLFFLKFAAFKTTAWQHYAWAFIPMFALFILDLVGMLYTPMPSDGAIRLEKHLSFLAFPLLFALLGPDFFNLKRLKGLGIVFYANCLFLTFMFVCVLLDGRYHTRVRMEAIQNILPTFLHSILLSPTWSVIVNRCHFFLLHHAYQSWLMITAMNLISVTWTLYPQWYKTWYLKVTNILLLLIFSCIGILMSDAHIGVVALILWCICTFGLLLLKRYYKTAIGGLAVAIGIMSICMIGFPSLWHHAKRASESVVDLVLTNDESSNADNSTGQYDSSVHARLLMWQEAIDFFKQKPLFGHGLAGEKNPELLKNYKYLSLYKANSHNDWLLYAIRFGIVGLIFLAAVWIVGFRYAYLTNNPLLFLFLLFALVFTQTECWLNCQIGITFFCLAYGLLVSFSGYTKSLDNKRTPLAFDATDATNANATEGTANPVNPAL